MATSKRRVAKEVKIAAKDELGKVATELELLYPGKLAEAGPPLSSRWNAAPMGTLFQSRSRAPPPMSAEPAQRPMGGARSGPALGLGWSRLG